MLIHLETLKREHFYYGRPDYPRLLLHGDLPQNGWCFQRFRREEILRFTNLFQRHL